MTHSGNRLRWIRRLPGLPGPNPRLKPALWHEYYCLLTRLAAAIAAVVEESPLAVHVVDLGAGTAPYRELFRSRCRFYWAVDLNEVAEVDVRLDPEAGLPFRTGSVDAILSSQVLEHVDDPARHLAEIRRVLSPGGTLVLSTHGMWIYHPHPKDFWRWTAAGLRKIVAEAGFEVLQVRGVLSLRATCAQIWQIQVQSAWPAALRPFFVAAMQTVIALEDWRGRRSRDEDACTYVVRARAR